MASLDTTINRKARLLGRFRDLWMRCESFQWSHDEYLDHRSAEMLDADDYKRAPIWVKEYLRGWEDSWMASIWRYKVIFSYPMNGKQMAINSLEYRAAAELIGYCQDTDTGAHIWCESGKFWTKPKVGET
jgi:hypothetical protein